MRREAKVGIFAVAMIIAAWMGIRFLKGFDVLSPNVNYYAAYDEVNGVQKASPIMIKGVKVGTVTDVVFDPSKNHQVVLKLTVNHRYDIPTDSEAKIFSNGLMGSKAIEIVYGRSTDYLEAGDTLRTSTSTDLLAMAGQELDYFKEKIGGLVDDLSKTVNNINTLLEQNSDAISGTLTHMNTLTGDVSTLLAGEKENLEKAINGLSEFSQMLGQNAPRIDSLVGSFSNIATELERKQFAEHLTAAIDNLNQALAAVNNAEGSAGLLLHDRALYDSLTVASGNLASLLKNVQEEPNRYVHISLFGKDPEKLKAKAKKRANKDAAKSTMSVK